MREIDIRSNKAIKLIKTARNLFLKHGIKKITVEEICQKANISKMTFYKYFENKKDILKKVLIQIFNEAEVSFISLIKSDIQFENKISKIVELKIKQAGEWSEDFIYDILNNHSEIFDYIQSERSRFLSIFIEFLNEALKKGEIRKSIKPEYIVFYIEQMQSLVLNSNYRNMFSSYEELISEMMDHFFYGIITRK